MIAIKQNLVLLSMVHANNIGAEDDDTVCHFRLMEYLELVDSTGRAVRDDKRGAISTHASDAQNKLQEYAQMTGRILISGQRLAGW